ncbi:hypothetical protein B1790_09755 [Mycobacterium sp. AT1]|nr:hypothetical protein B1790_09755 [Mycobacterium sp. AT1]
MIAGLSTLVVGFVALFGVILSSHLTRTHDRHNEGLDRCWERFTWLVDQTPNSDSTPQAGTSLFTPEVITEVVKSLAADAKRLDDPTLKAALLQYQQILVGMY